MPTAAHATSHPPRTYYSQYGEDAVIDAAFPDLERGFFIEVGCIDGRRASNTLMLEEAGWTGLLVEAHEDYIDLIRANRPHCAVMHCAVGDRDADHVTFYSNARASLSTLDPSLEDEFRTRYGSFFHGFVPKTVRLRTLSSILDELGSPHVNVLSIDIEGCDHLAVRGLDTARHRPDLIIVEAADLKLRAEVDAMLLPAGYLRGTWVNWANQFYFREPERLARVQGRRFTGVTRLTRHPMDNAEDAIAPFDFVG